MSLNSHAIALDEHFFDHIAQRIVAEFFSADDPAKFARVKIIVPNLMLAPALTSALAKAAGGGALLLPSLDTLSGTLLAWEASFSPMSDAQRQLLLHGQLRRQKWFDEAALWEVVGELTALFDQLTEYNIALPDTEQKLAAQLASAFETTGSDLLAFEARVAHTLWQAESQGAPSPRAARVMAAARWAQQLDQPLCVLLEEPLDLNRFPLLARVLTQCAERVPVLVFQPDRTQNESALAQVLNAAWPLRKNAPALIERSSQIDDAQTQAALERVAFTTADSLESLSIAAAEQVCAWIESGKERIAIVAADRVAARRTRALLERRNVLVQDETGWKLSTTRAAAAVDAWIETLTSDAYHRTLVDLLKSPLFFTSNRATRATGALQVERLLAKKRLINGLDHIIKAVQEEGDTHTEAAQLLAHVAAAREAMPQSPTSITQWLTRLESALEALDAISAMQEDIAGKQWLAWLRERRVQLMQKDAGEASSHSENFTLTQWRQWFNREMDNTLFRDPSIDSPVLITHLAATRLRPFDAAIVLGADTEHLRTAAPPAWLAHEGVRRALGLPSNEAERIGLREDMASLMLSAQSVVFAWQRVQRQEHYLPAPDLEVLIRTLESHKHDVVKAVRPSVSARPHAKPYAMPAPSVPADRLPTRISASALKSLLNCPYQYFTTHILQLCEQDTVTETTEKSEFGSELHALLQAFHTQFPRLAEHEREDLLLALRTLTEEAFAPLIKRNFLDHAWRLRWTKHLESYITWQLKREEQGWYFLSAETSATRELPLNQGSMLELYGRIDRIDQSADRTTRSLLDYKTRSLEAIKKQTQDPDDVQLAFYTLLQDKLEDKSVTQAAYVALDNETIDHAALAELELAAGDLWQRIDDIFTLLHQGQGLPANGLPDSACQYCKAGGLCRKDWYENF